jgi:UrcA family protein
MNRFTTTTLIIALGLGHQLANAAPPADVPSVMVHFADLDLTHSDSVQMLYGRLQAAAETVCASQNGRNGRDIGMQTRYRLCQRGALAAAVAKVDQPGLTAYHQAQLKGRSAMEQVAQH